jgi:hypothetical protein
VSTQRAKYKALKLGQETDMNEERIAVLEAVGFEWDRTRIRGFYDRSSSSSSSSNDAHTASEVPAHKSPHLPKASPRAAALPGGRQDDGVVGKTFIPSDPALTDRDSFNWRARASLGHFLPSYAGYMTDRGLSVAGATSFAGVADALGSSPESAARKRHGASEVNRRPTKVGRLKGDGIQPPQQQPQQQQRQGGTSNVTTGILPDEVKSMTEIVI